MKLIALGEVCTLINGGTPDTKNSKFWDGKHAWITPAEMGNLKSPFLGSSRRTLTDEGMRNSSAQLLPKHSVIMSSRAPIGHLIINEVPMASNQGCKGLIPNETLNFKYLYYFLYANKEYLNELGSGTTFAEISGAKLKTVLIPLPSLEKQRDIVNKLDSAFAEIDLLEANLKLSDYKANQLLRSLLSAEYSLDDIPVFPLEKLVDILDNQRIPINSTERLHRVGNVPYYGATGQVGTIDKAIFNETLILLGEDGVPFFDSTKHKAYEISGPSWVNNHAHVLRAKPELVIQRFLLHFLNIFNYTGYVNGATRLKLTQGDMKRIPVPVPDIYVQEKIVSKIDLAFQEISNLNTQIAFKKELANELRRSILSNAFTQEEAVA
jgi:type I restriction enzyme S subunit